MTTPAAGVLARLQATRAWLHAADPVMAGLIDRRPDYDPRHRLDGIPPMDLFGALVFQVTGQQLSVASRRRILDRIQEMFGGHLPSPAELLEADPAGLRQAGLSGRKVSTLRDLAERPGPIGARRTYASGLSSAFVLWPYPDTVLRRVKDQLRVNADPGFAGPELADELQRPVGRQRPCPPPQEQIVRRPAAAARSQDRPGWLGVIGRPPAGDHAAVGELQTDLERLPFRGHTP
jgi:HhH-GPD superfamily base excision DNA repair protein